MWNCEFGPQSPIVKRQNDRYIRTGTFAKRKYEKKESYTHTLFKLTHIILNSAINF